MPLASSIFTAHRAEPIIQLHCQVRSIFSALVTTADLSKFTTTVSEVCQVFTERQFVDHHLL